MAIAMDSITTRYGDTYTESDDNSAQLVADVADAALFTSEESGNVLRVISGGGDTVLQAQATATLTDGVFEYVIFNKTIILEDKTRLTGIGQNGVHAWFVNCTFIIEGDATNAQQTLGPAGSETSTIGGRTDTITGTKSGDTTWNYYGCSFVFTNQTTNEYNGAIVFGTIEGCDVTTFVLSSSGADADDESFVGMPLIQTMNNSTIDGLVINSQNRRDPPVSLFMFSEPTRIEGLVFNNNFPYLGATNEVTFEGYEQTSTSDFTISGTSSRPAFLLHATAAANMVSPRTQFDSTNSIIWRNQNQSRNSIMGSVLIQRQRISQKYFSDTALTEGRQNVKYSITSNATWAVTSSLQSINQSSSDSTNYTYETGTDGILEGTIDINSAGATVSSQDFEEIDLPVQVLASTTKNSLNQYGNDKFDFTNSIRVMSLWGTAYQATDKNGSTVVRTTPDEDGFFISPDIANNLDPDDALMAGLSETISNIGSNLTAASGNINLTDLGQTWKWYVWDNLHFDDWGNDTFSGDVLNVSGGTNRNSVIITPGQTEVAADGSNGISFDAPASSNIVDIEVVDSDVVQKLQATSLSASTGNSIRIDGGIYQATLNNILTFSTTPTSTDYSIRGATLNGTIDADLSSGTTAYMVLDNVDVESGGTLTVDAGDGTLELFIRGDAPTITTVGTVNISLEKSITLTGLTADFDSDALTARFASSSSSSVGTFFSESASNVVTVANNADRTVQIIVTVATDQSNLWYAIAYDGFDIVTQTNSTESAFTHELTTDTVAEIDFTITDFTTGDLDLSQTTVGAITSNTDNITITITDTDGETIPDNLTRIWLRKYVVENNNYMDAMAQEFVPSDYFSFDVGQVTIPATETKSSNRLTVQHSTSTDVYRSRARLLNRDLTQDLFESVTTSTTDTYFLFEINANGATAVEVEAIIDEQTDTLRGTDNRTLTETYNQAKSAKNAAFAS